MHRIVPISNLTKRVCCKDINFYILIYLLTQVNEVNGLPWLQNKEEEKVEPVETTFGEGPPLKGSHPCTSV